MASSKGSGKGAGAGRKRGKKQGDSRGLGPKPRAAPSARPAKPSARAYPKIVGPGPQAFERLEITRHRDLAGRQREIFRRLEAHPEVSVLLAINPVLALRELGVDFSGEMADHVLRALRHPPKVAARRGELEERLQSKLKENPQPNNGEWLARVLFEKLKLQPLATRGRQPVYRAPLSDAKIESLRKRRPSATFKKSDRPSTGSRPPPRGRIRLAPWTPAFRRMDLDADVPDLKPAAKRPKTVSLQALFFYKDRHPLARDLLELGIIQQRSFPIHTAAGFRAIKDGSKPNAFRAWIRSVKFPDRQ